MHQSINQTQATDPTPYPLLSSLCHWTLKENRWWTSCQTSTMTLRLVIVVVVLHIYPFTGQRQTLTLERSGHFSLHWLLRGWKNPHSAPAYRSFQCSCGFLRILVHWICCLFKAIIVKRLVQGRNNVTRVRVEARSCDQGRRKNDAFSPLPIRPRCRILLVDIDTTTLRLGIVCFKIRS